MKLLSAEAPFAAREPLPGCARHPRAPSIRKDTVAIEIHPRRHYEDVSASVVSARLGGFAPNASPAKH
jgi:hypothetical protein